MEKIVKNLDKITWKRYIKFLGKDSYCENILIFSLKSNSTFLIKMIKKLNFLKIRKFFLNFFIEIKVKNFLLSPLSIFAKKISFFFPF